MLSLSISHFPTLSLTRQSTSIITATTDVHLVQVNYFTAYSKLSQENNLWHQSHVYLVGRPEVFLQPGYLVEEGKIRDEAETLWHRGLGMLDARQHVEGIHIVHKLHTKLVFGRHLRCRSVRKIQFTS